MAYPPLTGRGKAIPPRPSVSSTSGRQSCREPLRRRAMPLDAFLNTFAGNPLDRASYKRTDAEWLARQLGSDDSLGFAMWNGQPFVEPAPNADKGGALQIAYLPAKLVGELAGGPQRLF